MDEATRGELIAELNTLLEAERAGARVGAALVRDARGGPFETLANTIQADEAKWAGVLQGAIVELGGAPSETVGDFYGKVMALEGIEARLALTNRGQGWVVRRLRELLPRIEQPRLHTVLQAMLDAHVANIEDANAALDKAAPPSA